MRATLGAGTRTTHFAVTPSASWARAVMVVSPTLRARNLPLPSDSITFASATSQAMVLVASCGKVFACKVNSLLSGCVNVAGISMRATLGAGTRTTHFAIAPPASWARAVIVVSPTLRARNLPPPSDLIIFASATSHSMALVASCGKVFACKVNSLLSGCVTVAGISMRTTLGAGTRTTHFAVTPSASCARAVMVVSPTLSARNLPPPSDLIIFVSATSHTMALVASCGKVFACKVNSLLSGCVNVAGILMRATLGAGTRTTHWAVTPSASFARAVIVVSPTLSARNLPPPSDLIIFASATSHTMALVASCGKVLAVKVNSLLSGCVNVAGISMRATLGGATGSCGKGVKDSPTSQRSALIISRVSGSMTNTTAWTFVSFWMKLNARDVKLEKLPYFWVWMKGASSGICFGRLPSIPW